MRRSTTLTISIPRWVDDEPDLTVHLCAEYACLARACALHAGARRHVPARLHLRLGGESIRQAHDRTLPATKRVKLLLRAEQAFADAADLEIAARLGHATRSATRRTAGQAPGIRG